MIETGDGNDTITSKGHYNEGTINMVMVRTLSLPMEASSQAAVESYF
jgi:hypothetical protein